ncbi:hypothetical protein K7A41_14965 [Sphingobacterium sp. InxBP1]|uniref:clostripain-related cysteine peptidase n=1 Tax=Sphingobacterium sp. InxBP1 TaxID=2870328 RepID=UPI002244DEBF|nr:clostripain-related cysteine peptidase [Sphingobacterium sp. InxBP1]MCW8312532.1 hypothetical protein [Sphingobacterium sp. InxBP1]
MMRLLFSALIILFFFSCKKEDPVVAPKIKYEHSLIVVMEANNNLRQYAIDNINDMESAGRSFKNSAVLVYLRSNNEESILLRIKFDENLKVIASDTLKRYVISKSSPEQLKIAINDAKDFCPADTYGLILWSHGTSWAPPDSKRIVTRSFGEDQGDQMDIIDLRNSIPSGFKYVIFDACNMASIEVLWEFKEKADYLIASPTEVLASGFPYGKVLPYLTLKEPDLKNVAAQYFEHYKSFSGQMQSASVTLINTKELAKLSNLCADLYSNNKAVGLPSRNNVQRLDYTEDFPVPSFDFVNYLEVNFPLSQLASIKNQLDKTIIYKNATEKFLGKPIIYFSGLTCFIPEKNDIYLQYYRSLTWYKDSRSDVLF